MPAVQDLKRTIDLYTTGPGFELLDPDGYWLWFGEDTDEAPTDD